MSKAIVVAAVLSVMGAAALPAGAQTPEPETIQPGPEAPEAPASEAAAPGFGGGPSHRITGAAVIFNLIDGDRDGAIDLEEASRLFEAIFTTFDANDDGKLAKEEINFALRRMHGVHGGRGYRDREEGRHYDEDE